MAQRTLSSERVTLTFGRDPLTIRRIRNRLTGRTICLNGNQSILIRSPHDISEPALLVHGRFLPRRGCCTYELFDSTRKYRAEIRLDDSEDGLRFSMHVKAPRPIWLVEWRLSGLDAEEIIVPALGGQSLTRSMPVDTTVSYKYPFWWNAQFAIGAADRGGFWVRSKENEPRLKMLRVRKDSAGFTLTYGFEAVAPLEARMLDAAWYLDAYAHSWKEVVDLHRSWLEDAFSLVPLHQNPHWPPWASNINFVLELWGMRKDSPWPHHTFQQMIDRLKDWGHLHDPRQTLVYLPGFAEHGIDSHAPDYNPSVYLGGPRKFAQLMTTAHRMGYRVMIHTNAIAMTFTHRLYPRFKKHQVVDPFGRTQGWGLDLDGDWLFEPYFAYINPGAEEWGELMEKTIGRLIRRYGVDGVFLDQTLLAFNTSRGPNFMTGMNQHIRRLERAFPGVLFAGEGLHELVLSALPMAQIHGLDSITEVHGLEGRAGWRRVHQVNTYLFGPYTRFTAHLLTRHPSSPAFRFQEDSYAQLGVLPALCLYNATQPMNLPEVGKMVRRAKSLSPAKSTDRSRT
jgi:hypothetical protein